MALAAPFAPLLGQTPIVSTILDSVGDMIAWSFEARSTTAIKKVLVRTGTTSSGTPGTLSFVLCADNNGVPNISGGIPADIGGGSPTLGTTTTFASSTNYTYTFTNAYTPTVGTRYWVVLYASAGTWDGSNRTSYLRHTLNFGPGSHWSALSTDGAGASWTVSRSTVASFSLADASDNLLPTDSAAVIASTGGTISPTVSSNPDEYGLLFTVPANCTAYLHGFWWLHRIADAVNSDHTLFMYTDPLGTPALLDSYTVDVSAYFPTTGVNDTFYWRPDGGPFTLTGGTVVSCSVRAIGTGTITLYTYPALSQAAREAALLLRDYILVTRDGGSGAFTQDLTAGFASIVPHIELLGTAGGVSLLNRRDNSLLVR